MPNTIKVIEERCTGCTLCVKACPVDCIAMLPAGRAWSPEDARAARHRYVARNRRLASANASPEGVATSVSADNERIRREAAVAAALARARARRSAFGEGRK